ncbi:MAG TPA: hypothetical protein VI565_11050, partial [Burkholderiales bacterium]|nr:hypothetical protein [Burkholderiales bacterium]
MLRLSEIRLPLEHNEPDIVRAICERLGIDAHELLRYSVSRRAVDARKAVPMFIYTLDAEVQEQARRYARIGHDRRVSVTPDTTYRFVTRAPRELRRRPVVI